MKAQGPIWAVNTQDYTTACNGDEITLYWASPTGTVAITSVRAPILKSTSTRVLRCVQCGKYTLTAGFNIQPDTWTYVALTYDGNLIGGCAALTCALATR